MVKLPWLSAYFPVLLYPFYWLFLLCFYFLYLPIYSVFPLFGPFRSVGSLVRFYERHTSRVRQDLEFDREDGKARRGIIDIRSYLGHSSSTVTEKHCIREMDERKVEVADLFERIYLGDNFRKLLPEIKKCPFHGHFSLHGGGTRNRTLNSGFGDRSYTF